MGRKKLLHGLAGVVARSILNDKNMLCGLCQDVEQKRRIALRVKSPRMGFGEKAPRKVVDKPKDFVRFASATGQHFRLVSLERPGIAQRAPLGKAGLIPKEQEGFALAGASQHGGPGLLTPLQALSLIEVIGDKAGFLVGKAKVLQQGTDIVGMILHPKLALNEVLDHRSTPAA